MNNKLIQAIRGKFKGDRWHETFKDYITDIHFPYYKGLVKDATIKFDFPLTVLVGENGCGKSSVLQAMENVAAGKSLSQRWFSTSVDPIPDGERPCFWYSYYSESAGKVVQILNTRIKKTEKDGRENPDYWEPSRPVAKYGMDLFTEDMKNLPGASGTRWNGTKRKVEYIDFREEISAFDKYFYFENEPRKKTKQEYVRQYSKYLKMAIDGCFPKDREINGKLRLRSVNVLQKEEVDVLSIILDKQYVSVKIVEHQFYNKWGTSVYFTQKNSDESFSGSYSEAFAGSGESAVAKLVHKIFLAKEGTLLLLDEPETSLHPGAQKRLLEFILKNVRDKGLQVVISSHSPAIVEELPSEAIVVMNQSAQNKFTPIPNIDASVAFQYIGHTNISKSKILVEDYCAELLVKRALNLIDEKAVSTVDVINHAGGAKDLFKEAVVLSRLNSAKTFLFLDGDQKKDLRSENEVADADLDDTLLDITGIDAKNLGFVADSKKAKEQLIVEERKYLDFLKDHCKFLPMNTPEEILWKCSSKSPKIEVDESDLNCFKKAIAQWVQDDVEGDVFAVDIAYGQRKLCNAIPKENSTMKEIVELVRTMVG